jgi:hypothetical protein
VIAHEACAGARGLQFQTHLRADSFFFDNFSGFIFRFQEEFSCGSVVFGLEVFCGFERAIWLDCWRAYATVAPGLFRRGIGCSRVVQAFEVFCQLRLKRLSWVRWVFAEFGVF